LKNFRNLFFYIALTGGFLALMYWIIIMGQRLEEGKTIVVPDAGVSEWQAFVDSLAHNWGHPLAILLVQIVTIILVARLFGWVFRKIGQPSVIGEIIAGIVLGPSLVGHYFPEFSASLFPTASLGNLQFLSQIGLILFMFVVGMELDLRALQNKAQDAVVISHVSIVFPFTLGIGLAYFIYSAFAPEGINFLSFSLFLGIAMSITAFPVLARIVQERGINKTRLGALVITCAAADDITAWCILAAVIAIVKAGSVLSSLYIILLAGLYVLLMLKVVKPFLKRVGDLHASRENLSKPIVAIFFLTLLLSAYATEVIGIHALFGAFMAGVIMPDNAKFRNIFIEKVEDVALVLLLPLFFVFTGLRTQIGLLNDPGLWQLCGLVILVAIVGKFLGSALAAKFVGQNWQDSLSIGALMNTRGLMELVVLNIGYDLGVLTPEIFAMMVIMALVTTFMTGPALDLINWFYHKKAILATKLAGKLAGYKVLISFGNPETGKNLLKIANSFAGKGKSPVEVTALHLSPSAELHHFNVEEYEKDSFEPILTVSKQLNQHVVPMFKASNDIDADILETANKGDYELLLVGMGQSIFEGSVLGRVLGFTSRIINPDRLIDKLTGKEKLFDDSPFDDRTRQILANSKIPVGVLVDKQLSEVKRIFLPLFKASDIFLLEFVKKIIQTPGIQISMLDAMTDDPAKDRLRELGETAHGAINFLNEKKIEKDFLLQQDLMIISLDSWKKLLTTQSVWLNNIPSALIIKP